MPTAREQEPGPSKSEGESTVVLPADKAYYLLHLEVLENAKRDLSAWAKGRFWIVSIIFVIGGASVAASLVEVLVRTRIEAVVKANETKLEAVRTSMVRADERAQQARDTAAALVVALDQFKETAGGLETRSTELEKKATELEGIQAQLAERASALRADLSDASVRSLEVSRSLRDQVAALTRAVGGLSSADSTFLTETENIEATLEGTSNEIANATTRARNSRYEISIRSSSTNQALVNAVVALGYSTSSFGDGDTRPLDSISVGASVPATVLYDAIRLLRDSTGLPTYADTYWLRQNEIVVGSYAPSSRELTAKDWDSFDPKWSAEQLQLWLSDFAAGTDE